jgi:hypothetical protein
VEDEQVYSGEAQHEGAHHDLEVVYGRCQVLERRPLDEPVERYYHADYESQNQGDLTPNHSR